MMARRFRDRDVLAYIFKNYVLNIPQIRVLLLPTALCMMLSRYLEVKISEITQKVSLLLMGDDNTLRSTLVVTYFSVAALSCLLIELQGFIFTGSVQRAFRVASRDAFKHFISLEHQKFHSLGSGEIQASINRKSRAVSEIIDVLALNFLPTILVILLTNIKLFYYLGTMPAIIVNTTLVVYTAVTVRIAIWRNRMRQSLNDATDRAANRLNDSLSNYDTVAAFNNENLETERFDEMLKSVEQHSNRLWRSFYLLNFLQRLVFSMQTASIILFGVYGIFMDRMRSDTFILYLTISRILASNLDKLGFMYCRYSSAMINAKTTHFVLPAHRKKMPLAVGEFQNHIRFKGVSLYYGPKGMFSNVNLQINKSEKVALVGRNGSGKSTLMRMLLRHHEYDGIISIDGENLQLHTRESLRSMFSYVQQDSSLFNDTVRYNIKYSNIDCPDYFMVGLCKSLEIHDSIMRLRNGYDTVVGERGKYLSGGERQKIALARALLCDTDILLLDEPTAALDKEAEYNIIKKMFELFPGKTVIMIVHNFDILKLFDRILCITSGTLKEIKRPEDLLREDDVIVW